MKKNRIIATAALALCLGLIGLVRLPSAGRAAGGAAGCGGAEAPKSGSGSDLGTLSSAMSEPDLDSVSTTEGHHYDDYTYFAHAKALDWNACINPFFGQCVEQWGSFAAACNGKQTMAFELLMDIAEGPEGIIGVAGDLTGAFNPSDPWSYLDALYENGEEATYNRFFPGKRCHQITNTRTAKDGGSSCYGGKWKKYVGGYSWMNIASTYRCSIEAPSAKDVSLTFDGTSNTIVGVHTFTHPLGATTERSLVGEIDMADDANGTTNKSVLASGTQDTDLSVAYQASYASKYLRYCVKTSFLAEKWYRYLDDIAVSLANTTPISGLPSVLSTMDQTHWTTTEQVYADSSVCGNWQRFDIPIAENVSFNFGPNDTAIGSYTYADASNRAESGTTFKWYFGVPGTDSWATTATTQTATVPSAVGSNGGQIRFCVVPHASSVSGYETCSDWSTTGSPSVSSVDYTLTWSAGTATASGTYSGWSDVISITTDRTGSSTCVSNGSGGCDYQKLQYVWKLSADSDGSDADEISNSHYATHTLATSDEGRYLFLCVTPKNNAGATGIRTCSDGTWIGPSANGAHSTLSGGVATGAYSFLKTWSVASESGSQFRWLRASDAAGSDAAEIDGATAQTYTTVSASDSGKYLLFCVVPRDSADVAGVQDCSLAGTYVPYAPSASAVTVTSSSSLATASYTYSDQQSMSESGSTLQWYRNSSNSITGATAISGATSLTYTLTGSDETKYVVFCVTPSNGSMTGSKVCTSSGVYTASPTVSNVAISSGTSYSGSYTWSDPLGLAESGSVKQWYRGTSSSFSSASAISGATSASYTASASDEGKYLFFCVTASNGFLTLSQSCSSGVQLGPVATSVAQTASGCSLTGSYTFSDLAGLSESGSTFAWQRNASNSTTGATAITGATSKTYTVTSSDNGMYVFFCVTPKTSGATGTQTCVSSGSKTAPTASNPAISQSTSTLTGSYTFTSCTGGTDQTPSANLEWWTNRTQAWSGSYLNEKGTGSTHSGTGDAVPYVSFCVTPSDGSVAGTKVCSGWFTWVPVASTVTVTASGSSLTGSYSYTAYNSLSSASTVQWYRSTTSSGTGTAISNATGTHYTAGQQDDGKYLNFCVTPVDAFSISGTVVCAQQAVFPTASSVAISGTGQTGQALAGSYSWSNIAGGSDSGSQLQWKRLQQGSWTNIAGATSAGYTPTAADATAQVEFCVTPSDGPVSGTQVCSSALGINPTVTFYTAQSYGGSSWTGVYGNGSCINLAGSANNSAQSLKWFGVPAGTTTLKVFDGASCSGTSATYTASANANGGQTTLGTMNSLTSSFKVTW